MHTSSRRFRNCRTAYRTSCINVASIAISLPLGALLRDASALRLVQQLRAVLPRSDAGSLPYCRETPPGLKVLAGHQPNPGHRIPIFVRCLWQCKTCKLSARDSCCPKADIPAQEAPPAHALLSNRNSNYKPREQLWSRPGGKPPVEGPRRSLVAHGHDGVLKYPTRHERLACPK
jgi:hypothetical protein